jgi:hypothetical protein
MANFEADEDEAEAEANQLLPENHVVLVDNFSSPLDVSSS